MIMRRALPLLLLLLAVRSALADGGAVRYSGDVGAWHVTAFTQPTPLRAGPVEISFLVQGAGGPVLDAAIEVRAARAATSVTAAARREAATNRMMYAAPMVLASPGRWTVEARLAAGGAAERISFALRVEPPQAPWLAHLPWLAIPVAGIALFAAHQALVLRRRSDRRPAGHAASGTAP
jgi:hypothetical protein